MGSLLIKGSTVIDGNGTPGVKADILVKGGRIVALGVLTSNEADVVIDGTDLIATPGFIDVNTDSDHYLSLFTDPAQQDFLLQGVTTIVGGQCGSSLAPLIKGTLDSIRKWGDTNLVNVNWHTFDEFLWTLQTLSPAINFATLVGHSTVRRGLLGDQIRDLTEDEMQVLSAQLRQALEQGALGVSTGLGYNHSRGVPYNELKIVASLAARFNGIYTTHLRDETQGLLDSVSETIALAKETGVKTVISHFRPIIGFEQQFTQALELIRTSSSEVYFDAYPFDYSILPVYMLLPESLRKGSLEEMQALIKDTAQESVLLAEFAKIRGDEIRIARAPGFDYSIGKTLTEYAAAQELDTAHGLLALMRYTRLKAVIFKRNINYAMAIDALMTDKALVASNSPSLLETRSVIENERAVKTFSKFIELSLQRGLSLEWAINKITMKPATLFGFSGRGVLAEGAVADIALLQEVPNEHKQRSLRALHVVVEGEVAVRDGVFQGVRNGKVIKRS
jgi:N-acyl-D-amino-acid deacylase